MSPHRPKIGKLSQVPRILQFAESRFDRLSFYTTPIEITGDGCNSPACHANGFFWRRGDESYLVTSWHVVTGCDPFTRERNHQGLIPRWLEFFGANFTQADDKPDYIATIRESIRIDLPPFGRTAWLEHPDFADQRIDIAIIPLCGQKSIDLNAHVNEHGFRDLFHFVGQDLYVVGYPLGSYDDLRFPIWKRGSLATEPLFPIDDKPMFLIDAATTEGMSGSPVFRRTFGPATLRDGAVQLDAVVTTEFVGVYSGCLTTQELARVGIGYA